MKILVIHDDASESGGANTFRRDLSRILRSLGIELFLFTYNPDHPVDQDHDFCYRFSDRLMFIRHISRHYFNPLLFLSLRRMIKKVNPDLIHIHQNDTFTSTVLAACMGRIPVVQTVHDHRIICRTGRGITRDGKLCNSDFGITCYRTSCLSLAEYVRQLLPGMLSRALMKRSIDAFLVPSEDLREKMNSHGLHATLLRHYVDITRYPPSAVSPEHPRLLFVGRMNRGKGVDVLLNAFKSVLEQVPEAMLDLVGSDEEGQRFQRLAEDLGINKNVVFHGTVPHEKMPYFYTHASVVVLPASWIENSPLVVLEAMASARPVVAGRIGGIPELVLDGETGLLCVPGDPADLSVKLLRLLKDQDLASRMGVRGRERVERHFSVEEHIRGYSDVLKRISGRPLPALSQAVSSGHG